MKRTILLVACSLLGGVVITVVTLLILEQVRPMPELGQAAEPEPPTRSTISNLTIDPPTPQASIEHSKTPLPKATIDDSLAPIATPTPTDIPAINVQRDFPLAPSLGIGWALIDTEGPTVFGLVSKSYLSGDGSYVQIMVAPPQPGWSGTDLLATTVDQVADDLTEPLIAPGKPIQGCQATERITGEKPTTGYQLSSVTLCLDGNGRIIVSDVVGSVFGLTGIDASDEVIRATLRMKSP